MDPTTIDDLLRALIEYLLKLWASLPPSVQNAVRAEWRALLAAVQAARASGVGSPAEFRAILEALKRFVEALGRAGAQVPNHVRVWIQLIERQIAVLSGEAAAGAGLTAAAVVLVLLALILTVMAIYEVALAWGPVDPPVGGAACGDANPIARNLEAENYSHWGQRRAFKNAEAEARKAAQQFTCTGTCTSGTCRGNCAITDVSYKYRVFWTWCTVKYDVRCECY